MRNLIREEGSFGANPGSKDLARHLYTRMFCGPIVIVAANPDVLLPALRKQWLKLSHQVQKQRASTLNASRIFELNQAITHMQTLRFTTSWPPIDYPADIHIATVAQLLHWAPEPTCRTIYITCPAPSEHIHLITSWLPPGALIITCKFA